MKRTARPASHRALATLLALCLPISGLVHPHASTLPLLTQAWAGPDDQRTVLDQGHIDSPKVFWDHSANNFNIKAQAEKTQPIEKTVSWISKTYNEDGSPAYIREVSKDPQEAFLGTPGTPLYWAQSLPSDQLKMIWQGFGASANVPTEQFRDASFQTDLLAFSGPGNMDLWGGGHTYPLVTLMSSRDTGHRINFLNKGTHSHNETTFTKPGRYELTLRASARTKDGSLIASQPQTQVWQVGGTRPNAHGIGDVRAAYDAANTASQTPESHTNISTPQLSISPTPTDSSTHQDAKYLSTLTFTTGNTSDTGTAVFYIDGFYLAEVKVTNGQASWDEMLGNGSSDYQVVYIPAAGSPTPRFISAPLSYERGNATATTTKTGSFPTASSKTPVAPLDTADYQPSSKKVQLTVTKESKLTGWSSINVQPEDPNLTLRVRGGYFYTKNGKKETHCRFDFLSTPHNRTGEFAGKYCQNDGEEFRAEIIPESRSTIGGAVLDRKVRGEDLFKLKTTLDLGTGADTDSGTTPTPAPGPSPSGDDNDQTATTELLKDDVELTSGHLDIAPMTTAEGLRMGIGDGTLSYVKDRTVKRDPAHVKLVVSDEARKILGEGAMANAKGYEFLGAPGTKIWLLPQVQDPALLWPGFSSEFTSRTTYPDGFDFEIEGQSAPAHASWWAFTSTLDGQPKQLASSAEPSTISKVSHLHLNWAFNTPGTYRIKVRAIPRTAAGTQNRQQATQWQTITFEVQGPDSDNHQPPADDASATGSTQGQKYGLIVGIIALVAILGAAAFAWWNSWHHA